MEKLNLIFKQRNRENGVPGCVSRKLVTGGVLAGCETTPLLNKNLGLKVAIDLVADGRHRFVIVEVLGL